MAINYTQSFGNTTPPAWLTPFLQSGAQGAQGLLGANTLAGQSQATLDAQRMAAERARAGSPANAAASSYVTDSINGKYLSQDSNPHLMGLFNQAALGTQNQLASQFAGSGRNLAASYAPRADQLNNLATQYFGGQYQFDRGLQQQAAGMAGQVSQAGYMDANALGAVGAAQDARAQQVADQPGQSLDDFLRRIGGVANAAGQETSQSNPYYTNNTANFLGTALGIDQLLGGRLSGAAGDYIGGLLGGGSAPAGLNVANSALPAAQQGPTVANAAALGNQGATSGLLSAGTGAAGGGLGSLGGTAFDSWLGSAGTINAGAMPTLAPVAGQAATGAASGAAASTGGAAGMNLATLGPIGAAIGAGLILRNQPTAGNINASGTTDPYAGLFSDTGYGGYSTPDYADPATQNTMAGIDPNSGMRWEHDNRVTTYYNPDGSTAYAIHYPIDGSAPFVMQA